MLGIKRGTKYRYNMELKKYSYYEQLYGNKFELTRNGHILRRLYNLTIQSQKETETWTRSTAVEETEMMD